MSNEWIFKGEGNANVVFSYAGCSAELTGYVLRLRKQRFKDKSSCEWLNRLESEVWSEGFNWSPDPLVRELGYVSEYIGPKLGRQYVHPGVAVSLPDTLRNASILRGMELDPDVPALLLPDHSVFSKTAASLMPTIGPAICVEVKPKCGFISKSGAIHPHNALKRVMPRYFLHQLLKHRKGKAPRLSAYNPLDLFSGDPGRMEAALRALVEVPHNNLKVFRDGELQYGGRCEASEEDGALSPRKQKAWQAQMLEHSLDGWLAGWQGPRIPLLVNLVSVALRSEGVLQRLLEVQRLDVHDIEGVYHIYCKLLRENKLMHTPSGRFVRVSRFPPDGSVLLPSPPPGLSLSPSNVAWINSYFQQCDEQCDEQEEEGQEAMVEESTPDWQFNSLLLDHPRAAAAAQQTEPAVEARTGCGDEQSLSSRWQSPFRQVSSAPAETQSPAPLDVAMDDGGVSAVHSMHSSATFTLAGSSTDGIVISSRQLSVACDDSRCSSASHVSLADTMQLEVPEGPASPPLSVETAYRGAMASPAGAIPRMPSLQDGLAEAGSNDAEALRQHEAHIQQLLSQPRQVAVQLLRDYLTAATAKDCGIMITMQQVQPTEELLQLLDRSGGGPVPATALRGATTAEPPANSMPQPSGTPHPHPAMQYACTAEVHLSASCRCMPDGSVHADENAASCSHNAATTCSRCHSCQRTPQRTHMHRLHSSASTISHGGITLLGSATPPPPLVSFVREPNSGAVVMFKLAYVDLDIKPLVKVPQHYQQDQRIIEHARQNTDLLHLGPMPSQS